jgi:type I restriction enzyme S subunit
MIADLKPYPEYKESGLPWLDTVPKHWDMVPNRALMRDQRGVVGARASAYTLLSLTLRGVIARDMVNPKGKFPAKFNTYKVVKPDDFVFCLFDIDETPRGVGLSQLHGMITGAYDVFSPTPRINPRFLYYYYLFVDEGKLMKPLYTGLRKTIQRGVFASLKAPLPPPTEQAAIVRFMDWANGRLERAIRAKRKVITLLMEQKQAIIHRAVTRGLDPTVPLKPSGIPWLGDIPQHWEVRRLRHLIKGRLTYGANVAAEFTNPDWPRYIRITDFRGDGSLKADTFRSLPPHVACDYMVDPGDILLARSGATVGKAFLVVKLTGAACHAGYLICARPNRGLVSPEFLFAFTQSSSFSAWKNSTFNTATIQNIGADKYANLPVPLPSLSEQRAILDSVAVEQVPLVDAISRLEREIDLLREYRTRLVADVVTGKLDVREAAARLPEEVAADTIEESEDSIEETDLSDDEALV